MGRPGTLGGEVWLGINPRTVAFLLLSCCRRSVRVVSLQSGKNLHQHQRRLGSSPSKSDTMLTILALASLVLLGTGK